MPHHVDGTAALAAVSTARLISLQTLADSLASTLDVGSVVRVVLGQGVATLEADAATLYLLAPPGDHLACAGTDGALAFGKIRPTVALDESLPAATAFHAGEPVWLESVEQWDAEFPNAAPYRQELGVKAHGAVPLIAAGSPLGVLTISFHAPRPFTDPDRLFIQIAAGQCALALARARLIESEREAAHRARLERERLAALFGDSPNLVIAFRGPQQIVEFCSGSIQRLMPGRNPIGRPAREVAPDLAGQGILEALDGVFIHGRPFVVDEVPLALEWRGRMRRRYVNIVIQPTRDPDGTITGTVFHGTDITDMVKARKRAERLAAERDIVLAQMADGLLLVDPAGSISYANHAAQTLLGGDRIGGSADALWEGTAAGEGAIAHALAAGTPITDIEAAISRPEGSVVEIQASVTPIRDEDRLPLGAVVTLRDISRQRVLERQKDDFLTAVAHDLKTPLTVIRGLTQLIAREETRGAAPNERLLDHLGTITETTSRMTTMINGLLDLTRLEITSALQLEREELDLAALLRRAASEQKHHTRHPISVEAEGPVVGFWDRQRLERIIGNLLSNAIRYSPAGGPIHCTAGVVEDMAVLSVTDSGIGIPEDDLPHIFERFYRGSNTDGIDGAGIGLAGVRTIVEQHGGWITVESGPQGGSTFTVRLPLGGKS